MTLLGIDKVLAVRRHSYSRTGHLWADRPGERLSVEIGRRMRNPILHSSRNPVFRNRTYCGILGRFPVRPSMTSPGERRYCQYQHLFFKSETEDGRPHF